MIVNCGRQIAVIKTVNDTIGRQILRPAPRIWVSTVGPAAAGLSGLSRLQRSRCCSLNGLTFVTAGLVVGTGPAVTSARAARGRRWAAAATAAAGGRHGRDVDGG